MIQNLPVYQIKQTFYDAYILNICIQILPRLQTNPIFIHFLLNILKVEKRTSESVLCDSITSVILYHDVPTLPWYAYNIQNVDVGYIISYISPEEHFSLFPKTQLIFLEMEEVELEFAWNKVLESISLNNWLHFSPLNRNVFSIRDVIEEMPLQSDVQSIRKCGNFKLLEQPQNKNYNIT